MKERLDMLSQVDEYIGKYYSVDWVRRNILRQSEEDIDLIDTQIEKEKAEMPQEEGEDEFGGLEGGQF